MHAGNRPALMTARGHWLWQRLTALALLPLSVWLLVLLRHVLHADFYHTRLWLSEGLNVGALALWLMIACYHAALGIEVVLEDYVSDTAWRQRINLLSWSWFALIAVSGLISLLIIYGQGKV